MHFFYIRNSDENIFSVAKKLRNAILNVNINLITELLNKHVIDSFSYYYLRKEKDYQIMVTTLFAVLFQDFLVKSEVNTRYGRVDLLLVPKNNKTLGIIVEIKVYKGRLSNVTLKKNALGAINQIKNMNYYLELKQLDIKKILLYSFVFDDTKNIIEYEMI